MVNDESPLSLSVGTKSDGTARSAREMMTTRVSCDTNKKANDEYVVSTLLAMAKIYGRWIGMGIPLCLSYTGLLVV